MVEAPFIGIHYSFGSHGPENSGIFSQVRERLLRFFIPDPRVQNIYLAEEACFPRRAYDIFQASSPDQGYLDRLLRTAAIYAQAPFPDVKKIAGALGDDIKYRTEEFQMIDNFPPDYRVQLELEYADDKLASRQIVTFQNYNDFKKQAIGSLLSGQIDKTDTFYADSLAELGMLIRQRNRQYRDRLSREVENAVMKKIPTRQFIRIGTAHDALLEHGAILTQRYPGLVEVTHDYDYGQALMLPEYHLLKRIAANPNYRPQKLEVRKALLAFMLNGAQANSSPGLNRRERLEQTLGIIDALTDEGCAEFLAQFSRDVASDTIEI